MQSENTADLANALCKAQSAMRPAIFNKMNPHFKNKYADLAAVLDAIRKPLCDNGLSVTQTTEMRANGFVLVTTLRHVTGQWVESEYPLPLAGKPQEIGSALTYARRYSLSGIVCIASEEDDDAEATRNGKMQTLPKKDAKEIYTKMQEEIRQTISRDHLKMWGDANKDRILVLPEDWQDILRLQYEEQMGDLRNREAA